jgi:hypothetical protein
MAPSSSELVLPNLPLEVLTHVCRHLDLVDLVRVSQSCKRFRHCGLETVELLTESPVVAALQRQAFPSLELIPRTRPSGCSEFWVAYLARCVRQRRCPEAPPFAAGKQNGLFRDPSGRLLPCGTGASVGHGDEDVVHVEPAPVASLSDVRVRSVAAGSYHSLALGWDGRVYSWGGNYVGQLGQGHRLSKPSPALVKGLEDVRSIAAAYDHSLAVMQSGVVFRWGRDFQPGGGEHARPIIVNGFEEGVRVRRVCAGDYIAFAVSEDGQLFSWGDGGNKNLGHGDTQNQPSPKRVEALRRVRVSSVAVGLRHALALTEDGLVYAWGENSAGAVLGNPNVEWELLPKPVEALRRVRVVSVAAAASRSYAVADTGELWAWIIGYDCKNAPLGHGERTDCPLPTPIESLRGVKVDAVAVCIRHTLTLAGDRSVYAWGNKAAARLGALGLGASVRDEAEERCGGEQIRTPRRIPGLRVACAL